MQFIDLKKQYERIKEKVDTGIHAVLEHGRYIMGPEIELLEKKLAESLVMKTAIGTLELLIQTGMSPEKLTKQVTSKGGTTEAAIRHLESKRFRLLIEQAIKKAWLRSSHLGNK